MKALGLGKNSGVSFKDIQILHDESGKPYVVLHGKAKEQMEELEELARQNAVPENSYASLQEKINNTNSRIDKLEERIAKLENTGETEEPTEPTEPEEEYPEYKQPTGAHDAYKTGDKITYNGKKYICKMDGCVWNPDTYPAGWKEVVENEENNEESEVTE